jgi:hypothetical protein
MCVDSAYAPYGGLSLLPSWLVMLLTCAWLTLSDTRSKTAASTLN